MKKNYFLIFMALGLFLVTSVLSCKDDEKELETAPPTGVTLDKKTLSLAAGATEQLTATVLPSAAAQTVSWNTTDAAVATVADGLVTAVAEGAAKIVVTSTEGGFTDTCAVMVTADASGGDAWSVDSTYLASGIWYKVVKAGEVAVVQNPAGQDYSGTVTIPSTVNGYTVKYIADHAFAFPQEADSYPLEYVDVPPTIVSFGNCAFQGCRGLKRIVIPDATIALYDDDFDGVNDDIGATFMGCTGLEEITIGAGITDLTSPNGMFQPWGGGFTSALPNLKKFTLHSATPLTVDGNSFQAGVASAILYIPAGADINAFLIDYWWDFASAEQNPATDEHEASRGGGIYHIGDCVRPWSLSVDDNGLVTWKGDASGGYDVVISSTELTAPSNGTHVTAERYNASDDIQNGTNYIYIKGACSDGSSAWVSTSFYKGCAYTVSGRDVFYSTDPDDEYDEPQPWGWDVTTSVEFWQNGSCTATVDGDAAFDGTTVQLIPGVEVTVKWTGSGQYGDPCTLLIKQGNVEILSKVLEDGLVDNESVDELIKFTPSCN
jgi:hypothetical protein